MDAIESVDWGAYSHFRFTGQQLPQIVRFFEASYAPVGLLIGTLVVYVIAVFILLVQGRRRAAIISYWSFIAAGGLLAVTHYLVPRRRPPDAQNLLGPSGMLDSYPSDSVLLCIVSLTFLGFALWRSLGTSWKRGLFVMIAALATVWICLSQLFLCIHFVTDLIGAMVGAAAIGWIACRLMSENTISQVIPARSDR